MVSGCSQPERARSIASLLQDPVFFMVMGLIIVVGVLWERFVGLDGPPIWPASMFVRWGAWIGRRLRR